MAPTALSGRCAPRRGRPGSWVVTEDPEPPPMYRWQTAGIRINASASYAAHKRLTQSTRARKTKLCRNRVPPPDRPLSADTLTQVTALQQATRLAIPLHRRPVALHLPLLVQGRPPASHSRAQPLQRHRPRLLRRRRPPQRTRPGHIHPVLPALGHKATADRAAAALATITTITAAAAPAIPTTTADSSTRG